MKTMSRLECDMSSGRRRRDAAPQILCPRLCRGDSVCSASGNKGATNQVSPGRRVLSGGNSAPQQARRRDERPCWLFAALIALVCIFGNLDAFGRRPNQLVASAAPKQGECVANSTGCAAPTTNCHWRLTLCFVQRLALRMRMQMTAAAAAQSSSAVAGAKLKNVGSPN